MKQHLKFVPIIALSILALIFAMWAGLLRMGWELPSFANLPSAHGPLMVSGFLGALIALERAVAIRQKWMLAVPVLAGFGWISLLFVPSLGAWLIFFASCGTLAILGVMVQRETQPHNFMMAVGTLAWAAGNGLWLAGNPIFKIVYWWIAFLVLTIGGERLELGRIIKLSKMQEILIGLLALVLLVGASLAMIDLNTGSRLSGLALLGLSLWFLRNDLARRNIHSKNPLTRYIAFCLYGGFIWMGVSGTFFTYYGALYAGPIYDAALHALFVGFVIAMIFGHAPIIFPAILGGQISFYRSFYFQLVLLHLSLLLRICGDILNNPELRRWGGVLNETAISIFLIMTIFSLMRQRSKHANSDALIH